MTTTTQASVLASSRCESAHFPVFHRWPGDPVDPGIASDGLVTRIDKYDLVIFERGILSNPVRVQNTKISASPSNTLLSDAPVILSEFELVDTLILGFSVDDTIVSSSFPSTPADTRAKDNITLFGFVSESARLIGANWSRYTDNIGRLSVFPSTNTKKETHNI